MRQGPLHDRGTPSKRSMEPGASSDRDNGTWAEIRVGAAMLFAERGYHATRMRDIAEAANLSKAALYYYVQGKDQILFDLASNTLNGYIGAARTAIDGASGDLDAITRIIDGHVGILLAKPTSVALTMSDTWSLSERDLAQLEALRETYSALVRRVLRSGQDGNILRGDIEVAKLFSVLFSLLNGTLLWWQTERSDDVETLTRLLTRLYLRGFVAGEADRKAAGGEGKGRGDTGGSWSHEALLTQVTAALAGYSPKSAELSEVASSLFREQGFLSTTTRDISRAAGFGNATLYHHVTDKQELLLLSYFLVAESRSRAVEEATAGLTDPVQLVRAFVFAHARSLLENVNRSASVVKDLRHLTGDAGEQARTIEAGYYAILTEIIRTGQARGAIIDFDASLLAHILLSTASWTTLWFSPTGRWTPAELAKAVVEIQTTGIAVGDPGDMPSANAGGAALIS